MAWDPNASPWDWDTGAVLLLGHGVDFGSKKQSHWPSEADSCSAKDKAPPNGALLPILSGMDSSSSAVHSSRAADHADLSCLEQRKLPTTDVAASLGNAVDWNDSRGGRDATAVNTYKRAENNWKGIGNGNTGFLELGSHVGHGCAEHKHQAEGSLKEESKCLEGKLAFQLKQQVKLPLGTVHQDTAERARAVSTEERHSSTATGSAGSGDSLVGLHLGKRTYFQDAAGPAAVARATQKTTKKHRATAVGSQPPRCQVDACETDLTSAKDYHRRHKVCEPHSKAGKVMVANQEKRFCQQCSRFHALTEFDEAKRSCRRRLAGHNERRRKPQINTSFVNSQLHSNYHDWPLLHQPRYHGMTSLWQDSADLSSIRAWPRMLRTDQPTYDFTMQTPGIDKQYFSKGFSPHANDKLPLLLFQSPKGMMPNDICSQSVHQYNLSEYTAPVGSNLTLASSSGAGGFSALETTPVTQVVTRVTDSGRALSLLSLPTRESHASNLPSQDLSSRTSITIDQLMNEDIVPQQLLHARQLHHHIDYTTDKLLSSIASNPQNLQCSSSAARAGGIDQCEGSFIHGLNGLGGFENQLCLATLQGQGHEIRGSEDAKQTIDLMHSSSFQSQEDANQVHQPMVAFHLGSSTSMGLEYTYESSFF